MCIRDSAEIDRIDRELRGKLSNLVLVGMPGSGKSYPMIIHGIVHSMPCLLYTSCRGSLEARQAAEIMRGSIGADALPLYIAQNKLLKTKHLCSLL